MKNEIKEKIDKLNSLGIGVIIHSNTQQYILHTNYYKFYILTHWTEAELIANLDEKIKDVESKPWLIELSH